MMSAVPESPTFVDRERVSLADVDRILARCHRVVDASRQTRASSRELKANVQTLQRRLRQLRHRVFRRRFGLVPRLCGSAGALAGVRVAVVSDDADLRDLMRLQLQWYGALAAMSPVATAPELIALFEPDLIVVDLPFDRAEVFALASRLVGRTPMVALTSHGHDHVAGEAIKAGFRIQVAAPVDPDQFERTLAKVLHCRAA